MKASIANIRQIRLQEDIVARLTVIEEKLDTLLQSGNTPADTTQKAKKAKVVEEVIPK